ncbi:MAG: type IV pili methyl-accepting chemotaxis transducer N-terminal domain-containing protein [Pseudomonadota bacterium]
MNRPSTIARATALATALVLAVPVLALPERAAAFETASTIRAKINLAGRQRMLSQRIAAKACLVQQGIDRDSSMAALDQAHGTFVSTAQALRFGDPDRNLEPEDNKTVLHYLEAVNKEWTPFGLAVRKALKKGQVDEASLTVIAERSLPVLKTMDKAVRRMTRTYGKKAGIREDARAVNYAGAQRMLTQRMAKTYCFVSAGVVPDASRFDLQVSADLFTARLAMLRNGDAGEKIAPPATPEVAAHLADVDTQWAAIRSRIDAATAGSTPGADDVADMAAALDALLRASHAAVQAMAAVDSDA